LWNSFLVIPKFGRQNNGNIEEQEGQEKKGKSQSTSCNRIQTGLSTTKNFTQESSSINIFLFDFFFNNCLFKDFSQIYNHSVGFKFPKFPFHFLNLRVYSFHQTLNVEYPTSGNEKPIHFPIN
jgi:hypothetical protein